MKKIPPFCFFLLFNLLSFNVNSNNIQVSNVRVGDDNPAGGYAIVQFDLTWENSWRTLVAPPTNWDAAWVFVKYREVGGTWRHAWLNDTGHFGGSGTGATIDVGLKNDKLSFNPTDNPGIGAMVYRSSVGFGTFSASNMQLQWNYYANGVVAGTQLEVQVYAIEMIFVPGGAYWLGDGVSAGTLRQVSINAPYNVTDEGSPIKIDGLNNDGDPLEGGGIWVSGPGGISRSAATQTDVNTEFPTGFHGYYLMKYEISQGQYRDFLNTLTRVQQDERTWTNLLLTNVLDRYVMSATSTVQHRNGLRCDETLSQDQAITIYCDLDGDGVGNEENDGEWLACNFLSWADGVAFLDWSGLRPMTELEFEKACRGPKESVPGEYAWGNSDVVNQDYSLTSDGQPDENIDNNYNTIAGNASYGLSTAGLGGPLRVGIFSSNSANISRVTAGAGYYGAMELSGNLLESIVSIGNFAGRSYTGHHGDGELNVAGASNVNNWPEFNSIGRGARGGSWEGVAELMRTSNRYFDVDTYAARNGYSGFRGCRSASPISSGY